MTKESNMTKLKPLAKCGSEQAHRNLAEAYKHLESSRRSQVNEARRILCRGANDANGSVNPHESLSLALDAMHEAIKVLA